MHTKDDLLRKNKEYYKIAIFKWYSDDGIADVVNHELASLNQETILCSSDPVFPPDVEVLFTFGPYGKTLPIWMCAAEQNIANSPIVVHWNTEGLPDLRIPWRIMSLVGSYRSKVDRIIHSRHISNKRMTGMSILSWLEPKFYRFRYLGDYEYAYKHGWLQILADTSQIYCNLRRENSMPTIYAPWGSTSLWYTDLKLDRDIDVLWMGKRGTKRRGKILDNTFNELDKYGVLSHIADNELNPFIFDEERTEYLNRSKITLNITRTWYDDNFSRFALAASNRSLIVSEPVLPHCPEFKEGIHYVSAPIDELPKTIQYYLTHEDERSVIVENAYKLMTTDLAFRNSLSKIINSIDMYKCKQENKALS